MNTPPDLPMDREAVLERMAMALASHAWEYGKAQTIQEDVGLYVAENARRYRGDAQAALDASGLLDHIADLEAENERIKQNHGCARGQRTTQWCGEAAETHARLRAFEAENAKLKLAAVKAVIPLEALRLSGTADHLSPEVQTGIQEGIEAVRDALDQPERTESA
jgi:hypothetical protein